MPPLASMTHGTAEYRCECGRRYTATLVVQPLNGPGLDNTDGQRCNARKPAGGRTCWKNTGHEGPHSWDLIPADA